MHTTNIDDGQPVCQCGARCWMYGLNPGDPCIGEIHVSESISGLLTHFCDHHGRLEDGALYKATVEGYKAMLEKYDLKHDERHEYGEPYRRKSNG